MTRLKRRYCKSIAEDGVSILNALAISDDDAGKFVSNRNLIEVITSPPLAPLIFAHVFPLQARNVRATQPTEPYFDDDLVGFRRSHGYLGELYPVHRPIPDYDVLFLGEEVHAVTSRDLRAALLSSVALSERLRCTNE
jgi:hypothetical protein